MVIIRNILIVWAGQLNIYIWLPITNHYLNLYDKKNYILSHFFEEIELVNRSICTNNTF